MPPRQTMRRRRWVRPQGSNHPRRRPSRTYLKRQGAASQQEPSYTSIVHQPCMGLVMARRVIDYLMKRLARRLELKERARQKRQE